VAKLESVKSNCNLRTVQCMVSTRYLTYSPDWAEVWNLIIPRSHSVRETDFLVWVFRKFARIPVNRVLDAGCGTGRTALELARRGYHVTGIDPYGSMLRVAKSNTRTAGLGVRFSRGSLEAPGLRGRYDAVYSILDPFNYLLTERSLSKALSKIHKLIRPGGVLIIDTMNFASLYTVFKKRYRVSAKGKDWSLQRRVRHEIDDVNMLWYHYESNAFKLKGKLHRWSERHLLRMWTFPELRTALEEQGFTKVLAFEAMKLGAKEAKRHADRLTIVANRM
jgi:SAM-dependent methyltransferase